MKSSAPTTPSRNQGVIRFEPSGILTPADPQKSCLEVALESGVEIGHSCGGMGSCGTCRVLIESVRALPERTEIEAEMAEARQFAVTERLACQLPALPDLVLRVPEAD